MRSRSAGGSGNMGETTSTLAPSAWVEASAIASSRVDARSVRRRSKNRASRDAAGPKSTTREATRARLGAGLLEQGLLLPGRVDGQPGACRARRRRRGPREPSAYSWSAEAAFVGVAAMPSSISSVAPRSADAGRAVRRRLPAPRAPPAAPPTATAVAAAAQERLQTRVRRGSGGRRNDRSPVASRRRTDVAPQRTRPRRPRSVIENAELQTG